MRSGFFTKAFAASILATPLFLTAGCGGGGSHNTGDIHGIVLIGNKSAFANPTGADGLTPAGAGLAVHILHGDGYTFFQDQSVNTDKNGRFTAKISLAPNLSYYCDIAKSVLRTLWPVSDQPCEHENGEDGEVEPCDGLG